jgi:DNA gyrase subunit A
VDIVCDARNGELVATVPAFDGDQLLLITDSARVIRMAVDDIREVGRRTRGVRLMRLSDGERIVGVERVAADDVTAAVGEEVAPVPVEVDESVDAVEPVEDDDGDDGDDADE